MVRRTGIVGVAAAVLVAVLIPAVGSSAASPASVPVPPEVARQQTAELPGPRVVGGGEVAPPGTYPWMVSIQTGSGHFCGGTLVTASRVLTAAHCLTNSSGVPDKAPGDLTLVIGRHDLTTGDGEALGASAFHIHPLWNGESAGGLYDWDLAMVDLASASAFPPVTLATAADAASWDPLDPGTTMGWGRIDNVGTFPDTLHQVDVPFTSEAQCGAAWGGFFVPVVNICAGDLVNGGVDSCVGDSGGPIVAPPGASGWKQVGLVSSGPALCGDKDKPGIYAFLPLVRSWIEARTGGSNAAPTPDADALTTAKNMDLMIDVAADLLAGDTDDWDSTLLAANVTVDTGAVSHGTLTDNLDGTLTYDPDPAYEGPDSFTYTVKDSNLAESAAATVSLTVTNNQPPTDMDLQPKTVPENSPANTVVGTLTTTDPDSSSFTYTLVAGQGSTGNSLFTIDGDTVKTAQPLDHEVSKVWPIRVRTDDGAGGTYEESFVITVLDVNEAPTSITLDPSTIVENQPAGTLVGNLASADQDAVDSHTYSFVAGAGDTDNARFTISGTELRSAEVFDDSQSPLSIRVRSTDSGGLTFDQQLSVFVTDVNQPPTDILLEPSAVPEGLAAGSIVGELSAVDPDTASHTFTLVAGVGDTDNARFSIGGNTLFTKEIFSHEATPQLSIRVRADDGLGGTVEKVLIVNVTDVNKAPTGLTLTPSTLAENQPAGTQVGTFVPTDSDSSIFTYELIPGVGDTDNSKFTVDGNVLRTTQPADFETKPQLFIRAKVTDDSGGFFIKAIVITVTDVNDPPSSVSLTSSSIPENSPSGTVVGTLVAADQDSSSFTYSLAPGSGDTDNASFAVVGSQLRVAGPLDFEAKAAYTVRVRIDDKEGGVLEQPVTVSVTNVNEAPVAVNDSAVAVLGTPVTIPVLANDVDPEGDPMTPVLESSPSSGAAVVQPDGTIRYTPQRTGTYTFRYHASDFRLDSAPATVTVVVTGSPGPVDISPTVALGLVEQGEGLWTVATGGGLVSFYFGNPGDSPFMGDWDCDGIDTPGLLRTTDGFAYLRNSNTQGLADIRFFFGDPGDVPIVGDFNGDGCDTLSLYRPATQTFFIVNRLGSEATGLGSADFAFAFGNPGDRPFAGDLDGDGTTEVALHRPSTGLVYYRLSLTPGVADRQFIWGNPADVVFAGDWNGDGTETVGLYRAADDTLYLRNSNTAGPADVVVPWTAAGSAPIAGRLR